MYSIFPPSHTWRCPTNTATASGISENQGEDVGITQMGHGLPYIGEPLL